MSKPTTVRSSVPLEQYKALGGATVSVCYGASMRLATRRKRTDGYGREWMDEYFTPASTNVDFCTARSAPNAQK